MNYRSSTVPGSTGDARGPSLRSRVPSPWTALAVASLVVPFLVAAVRIAATSGHVFLSDDLALVDLHVRDALGFHQQLGPFDRFGWNHPGPVYFYLLSIPARLIGSGAKAEFLGATLIDAAAALTTVWVVRRRCGERSALWCAGCLGLTCLVLVSTAPGATTFSESPLGALVSPWNPDVVILPLLLFAALCAASVAGSSLSLLGATLVGSFCVQTNFATLPVVAAGLAAALIGMAVRAVLSRRPDRSAPQLTQRGRHRKIAVASLGICVLLLVWVPTLSQQLTGHPGNLTLIWRFFTESRPHLTLGTGLWSILAVDGALVFGLAQEMSWVLGAPHTDALLVLAGVLVVGVLAFVTGWRHRSSFAAALGALSLLELAVCVLSVTRIVGPVYGYLVVWEIGMPVLALIGLGSAALEATAPKAGRETPPEASVPRPQAGGAAARARRLGARTIVPAVIASVFGVALTVQTAQLPALTRASDPTVALAWHLVAPRLHHSSEDIFLGDAGTDAYGLFTFFGLFDELQASGFHPRVSPFWKTQVGPRYLSNGREQLQVVLYPPSVAATRMPGYVGHTAHADIVISPGPPAP
ncbi:MAG TPA: hypothetical protein VMR97_02520 [Acidimicrobiales bacterium]|nr:hypothetical protein [Acidimicrobiales bacterium]